MSNNFVSWAEGYSSGYYAAVQDCIRYCKLQGIDLELEVAALAIQVGEKIETAISSKKD